MNIGITFRKINKNRKYFLVNTIGLSIALTCTLLVYSYIKNELSYDKFHSKHDRILRITEHTNTGISSMIDARCYGGFVQGFKEKYSQIQDYTKMSSFRKATVVINNNAFYSNKVFSTDSSFFNVFDYVLLTGNKKTLFNYPNQLAITESIAITYFGTIDVIGKQVKIMDQRQNDFKEFTIKGVLKDFPSNSHFKADFLCSKNDKENDWSYDYILLAPGINYLDFQKIIQEKLDTDYSNSQYQPIINLQPLTDIHLFSHKSRELENNGNVNSLILLFTGTLMILIIAFINFINLNFVQYIAEQKNINIKTVNGASRLTLVKEFLMEILFLIVVIIFISYSAIFYLANYLGIKQLLLMANNDIIIIILSFIILVIIFAIIPYLFRKNKSNVEKSFSNNEIYKIFLIVQFALSIVAIVSTLFLQKQINYLNFLHPKSKDSNIIVVSNNSSQVIAKFDILKERLLKYSEIINASAISEEPAGAVTDNFSFTIDGDTSEVSKTINVLVIDTNFFSFMGVKPIAGTVNIGITPSREWENKAIELWQHETYKTELSEGFNKDEITSYSEKYIINKTALYHLGFKNAQDAIGKRFQLMHQMTYLFPKGEIIGVVDDFHYTNIYEIEKPVVMIPRKIFRHNFLFLVDSEKHAEAIAIIQKVWNEVNVGVPFQY